MELHSPVRAQTQTQTHIPEGAQWGWKQEVVKFTPARVRTVIYPHHRQGQQMWRDRVEKGTRGLKGGGGGGVTFTSLLASLARSVNGYCSLGPARLFV